MNPIAGKFEVYTDKNGKFGFRLKAGNGEIMATGESYASGAACLEGVDR
ncbi:YegP family protein [Embleya sp. NPDC020630]